jgi:DNA-binding MarR family transcriptional regulator
MPNKSDIQTEINFLAALEAGKVTSQMRLSQRIGVSVGLINALIKRAILKGYVKARSAPAKRYAYYLTPKGFSEKSRLVADYLETSLDFFRMARAEYGDIFERLRHCGDNRIILGGRGELTEIALLAAREQGLEPTAVFDRETNAEYFHGLTIIRTLDGLKTNDTVVITESRYPQLLVDALQEHQSAVTLLAPSFLQISAGMETGLSRTDVDHQESGDRA